MAAKAAGKAMTKSEIHAAIAEKTNLNKKDVAAVFDELSSLIERNLSKKGPGVFTVPGLMKITVQHKPATPERPGKNPFTGEDIIIQAKPAKNVVKIRPLKSLKDMV